MTRKKLLHILAVTLVVVIMVIIALVLLGTVAHATGLVDNTINESNLYSKFPLSNYQLDFYVDNSWAWLPWNWGDGIGKSVMYGLYCITNFIWTIILYLSNATGYVIQEAYKLNFIDDMANSIGTSMQTLAGVSKDGFSTSGFYVSSLLILILGIGVYVAYVGLIKRETSKAIHAIINFVVVFLVSASFIAFAPDYIKLTNEFSSDISTSALDLGTKIIIPNSESKGKDSVDLIRDSLFAIQIKQPWMLLQFGNSNIEEIGVERVKSLESISPSLNDGKDREAVVKAEIGDRNNKNLTLPEVVNRLGMVFFLLFFNLGITIFVFLLTAMMIFSQILFIIFAMFLPISFLLSMIPSYESMGKQAIIKVFNTIMMRAGITLIITVAFSISTMLYNISGSYPFFMTAFLQIVVFAGIYFKLGEIMSMFNLNANDSQGMGRRMIRSPYMFMRRRTRGLERRLSKSIGRTAISGASKGAVTADTYLTGKNLRSLNSQATGERENIIQEKRSMGKRIGTKLGKVADTKGRVVDKVKDVKQQVKDLPVQARYAVHSSKEKAKENMADVKRGIVETKGSKQAERQSKAQKRRQNIAQKRMQLQKLQEQKASESARRAKTSKTPHNHERSMTKERGAKVKEVTKKRLSTTSEGIKRDSQSATERKQSPQDRNNNNININKGRKK